MKHAEMLTDRILFLDGLPELPAAVPAAHRADASPSSSTSDMLVEQEAVDAAARGRRRTCASVGDITSPPASSSTILADEEQHIDYLETQLQLIDQLGLPLYLAQLVEQPSSD